MQAPALIFVTVRTYLPDLVAGLKFAFLKAYLSNIGTSMNITTGRRKLLKTMSTALLATPAFSLFSRFAHAAKPQIYTHKFSDLALEGHDTVAYFKDAALTKGNKSISLEHKGAKWLFSSDENLAAFAADPDKYMPQFGGYCAFSVAKGKLVKGDPELWHVEDEKLYVNFNKGVHRLWLKRKQSMIADADSHWPAVLG